MVRFVARRLFEMLLVLLAMSMIVFAAVRLAPGDPAFTMLGPMADEAALQRMRTALGLDKPVWYQYVLFLKAVARGDLGVSISRQVPVIQLLREHMGSSLLLVSMSMTLVVIIGVPLGVLAAIKRHTWSDFALTGGVYFLQAAPSFWLAVVLILLFSVRWHVFPTFGKGGLQHLVLPVTALGLPILGRVVRIVRSGMLEVLRKDYVRTARSKGLAERVVVVRHALRNFMIPFVTDVGMQFGWLIGSAVAVEEVFAWTGVGRLAVWGILSRDYPVVQGAVLLIALVFVVINLTVDLLYTVLDPRIRYD